MARQLKLSYIIEATEGASAQVLDHIGSKLDALGRSYAGVAAMIGGGLEIKASVTEDSYFRQLAALTDTSLKSLNALKGHIHDIAKESKVSSDEMIQAMAAFKAGGGSFEEFGATAQGAADAIGTLGGKGEQVGRILAALDRSFEIKGPANLTRDLAMLTKQIGSVNGDIEAFAQVFPDLAVKYAAEGHIGEQGARELGAVFATLQQTSRSPRSAYGAVQSVIEIMQTQELREHFTGLTGIRTEDRLGHARSLVDVIRDISIASRDPGRAWNLNHALDAQAIAAMQNFSSPAGQALLARLMAVQGDPQELARQRALATSGIGGTATKWHEEIKSNADSVVEFMDKFAPALDSVSKAGADVLTVLGGAVMARGLVSGLKMLGGAIGLFGDNVDKAQRAASAAKSAGVQYFAGEGFGSAGAAGAGAAEGAAGAGIGAALGTAVFVAAAGAAAVIGAEKGLDWLSHRFGLPTADERARDYRPDEDDTPSWLRWSEPSRWFGHDYPEIPGVPDIHAAEDVAPLPHRTHPLGLGPTAGMHLPGSSGFGDSDRVRRVARYLADDGLTADQASGVAAGAFAESGLDPGAVNPVSGAYGIGQWLGSRKAALMRRYGAHPSLTQQLDFLNWELHGGDAGGASVLSEHSAGGALDAYIRRFMRPAPGAETFGDLARARNMLARIGGEITIKVEAADGTKARVSAVRSSNPDVPLTVNMGVGMVAP